MIFVNNLAIYIYIYIYPLLNENTIKSRTLLNLLYTHRSEVQVAIALSLIHTHSAVH
jgi:hypothetical protein